MGHRTPTGVEPKDYDDDDLTHVPSRPTLLFQIHHILGKLSFFVHLARQTLTSHQCGPGRKTLENPGLDQSQQL